MQVGTVRWAAIADAAPIAKLWHDVWHATYRRHVQKDALQLCGLPSFVRRVGVSLFERQDLSARLRPTALVAEQSAQAGVCGFAIIRGGAEIEHIYVAPEAHGTGVASKLLVEAERVMLEERGCEVAHLVVSVSNLQARRFYEKHGWIGSSRQPWMSTAPWQAVRPPELQLPDDMRASGLDDRGGLTEAELAATTMRCTQYKKFLGFETGPTGKFGYGGLRSLRD